jgi:hypothetical protein
VLGFSPKDSFQIAKADMIVDGIVDFMEKVANVWHEQDEELKVRHSDFNVCSHVIQKPINSGFTTLSCMPSGANTIVKTMEFLVVHYRYVNFQVEQTQ